ncbi:hypothetical protein MBLNU457_7833t1 [Dothideomycetes sp. NU457]
MPPPKFPPLKHHGVRTPPPPSSSARPMVITESAIRPFASDDEQARPGRSPDTVCSSITSSLMNDINRFDVNGPDGPYFATDSPLPNPRTLDEIHAYPSLLLDRPDDCGATHSSCGVRTRSRTSSSATGRSAWSRGGDYRGKTDGGGQANATLGGAKGLPPDMLHFASRSSGPVAAWLAQPSQQSPAEMELVQLPLPQPDQSLQVFDVAPRPGPNSPMLSRGLVTLVVSVVVCLAAVYAPLMDSTSTRSGVPSSIRQRNLSEVIDSVHSGASILLQAPSANPRITSLVMSIAQNLQRCSATAKSCDQQLFVHLPIAAVRASVSSHCFYFRKAYVALQDARVECRQIFASLEHTETAFETTLAETTADLLRIEQDAESHRISMGKMHRRPTAEERLLAVERQMAQEASALAEVSRHLRNGQGLLQAYYDNRRHQWSWLDTGLCDLNRSMVFTHPSVVEADGIPWLCHVARAGDVSTQLSNTLSNTFAVDDQSAFEQYWKEVERKSLSNGHYAIGRILGMMYL